MPARIVTPCTPRGWCHDGREGARRGPEKSEVAMMVSDWREAVEEHRDAIEAIAQADGPLADDCKQLLEEAEGSE